MGDIKITELPDGGCIVEMDGEAEHYTAEEVAEMERNYLQALERLNRTLERGETEWTSES